jgi:hypothetical protein
MDVVMDVLIVRGVCESLHMHVFMKLPCYFQTLLNEDRRDRKQNLAEFHGIIKFSVPRELISESVRMIIGIGG